MIDPEEFEATEEQFSASIASRTAEASVSTPRTAAHPTLTGVRSALRTGIEREFAERGRLHADLERRAEFWREEVADRVENYRTRRSRKRLAGEFSMKLNFDNGWARGAATAAALDAMPPEPELSPELDLPPARPPVAYQQAPELLEDLDPLPPVRAAVFSAAPNLIEFPRLPSFELLRGDELAEPMLDTPRILEVPDAVENDAPTLANLELEPPPDDDAGSLSAPEFDIPLQVAAWPQRFLAALIDLLAVVVGTALFALIVAKVTAGIPHTRANLALALAIPSVFWAVYHYLFLVYAGCTPGMQLAGLSLSTFEGGSAPRRLRRWRGLMMVLSWISLGLGFVWALFDEDNLCWHDKMTRTYLKLSE